MALCLDLGNLPGPCTSEVPPLAVLQPQPSLYCAVDPWERALPPRPNPPLMAWLPRADCAHVCTAQPWNNQGWGWDPQVGSPHTCARGCPR